MPTIEELKKKVKAEAERQGLGALVPVLNQLVYFESSWNPNAHGTLAEGEDSWGLFQLNRNGGVGKGYSATQLRDPDTNIKIAITHIANQIRRGRDVEGALSDWSARDLALDAAANEGGEFPVADPGYYSRKRKGLATDVGSKIGDLLLPPWIQTDADKLGRLTAEIKSLRAKRAALGALNDEGSISDAEYLTQRDALDEQLDDKQAEYESLKMVFDLKVEKWRKLPPEEGVEPSDMQDVMTVVGNLLETGEITKSEANTLIAHKLAERKTKVDEQQWGYEKERGNAAAEIAAWQDYVGLAGERAKAIKDIWETLLPNIVSGSDPLRMPSMETGGPWEALFKEYGLPFTPVAPVQPMQVDIGKMVPDYLEMLKSRPSGTVPLPEFPAYPEPEYATNPYAAVADKVLSDYLQGLL